MHRHFRKILLGEFPTISREKYFELEVKTRYQENILMKVSK